ncbi:hypothetical protein AK812_SmicGene16479 [Symbiodinium microadriaticum]|uniref:Uncharacterized protein n=1 Tax=Symbiodinium microadriaticum TaxID=2951 RepID=A0A1Q9E082_SYMMI|nr:hypothetical protein AK812_SmicGene16479 [Symbiodinium microadriaticum]
MPCAIRKHLARFTASPSRGTFGKSAAPSPAGRGQLRVAFLLGSVQAAALLRKKARLRARAAPVLDEEEEDDLQEEDADDGDDSDDDYDDYEDDPNYEGPWQPSGRTRALGVSFPVSIPNGSMREFLRVPSFLPALKKETLQSAKFKQRVWDIVRHRRVFEIRETGQGKLLSYVFPGEVISKVEMDPATSWEEARMLMTPGLKDLLKKGRLRLGEINVGSAVQACLAVRTSKSPLSSRWQQALMLFRTASTKRVRVMPALGLASLLWHHALLRTLGGSSLVYAASSTFWARVFSPRLFKFALLMKLSFPKPLAFPFRFPKPLAFVFGFPKPLSFDDLAATSGSFSFFFKTPVHTSMGGILQRVAEEAHRLLHALARTIWLRDPSALEDEVLVTATAVANDIVARARAAGDARLRQGRP